MCGVTAGDDGVGGVGVVGGREPGDVLELRGLGVRELQDSVSKGAYRGPPQRQEEGQQEVTHLLYSLDIEYHCK